MSTDAPLNAPPPPPARTPGPLGGPRSIGLWILLSIVTLGIANYVWVWRTQEEVKRRCGEGVGGWLGLVIYFVIAPVTFFLIPNEVQKLYRSEGDESPVGTLMGLWFLLPIIGWIIWFVKVQGALNGFWEARGATP